MNKNAKHYIADESIGGIEREYVEVERKADVGDYIISKISWAFTENKPYEVVSDDRNGEIVVVDDDNDEHVLSYGNYKKLEPTDIVRIEKDGVGEKVLDLYFDEGVFIREVVEPEYASEKVWYTFETEHGEDTAPIGIDEYCVLEPIENESEPLTVDETQASPEVVELLANLARRVTQLEEQLRDTQRNVETFAQQTESNSEDIRLLGERTTCDCTSKSGAELLAEAFGALTRYEKRGDRQ